MTKGQFDRAFNELPPRRREVLLAFLAGKTDDEIAKSLFITSNTVRQHIKEICDTFLVDVKSDLPSDKRQHRRPELIALFAQYKPELLPNSPQNGFICGDGNGDSNTETRWVGREALIKELIEKLQGNCRILSIVGITGIGKTSLAKQLAKQPQLSQKLPEKEISFFQEDPKFQVVAERILGAELANSPQLQQNPEELVKAMVNQLKSQPILLILDMIEVILEPDGKSGHQFKDELFAKFLDRVVLADTMPSRIILTSQDRPPVMVRGEYPERFFEKPLRGLEEEEAIALFRQWDVTVEGEKTQEYLQRIFAVYEGHPLALSAIAGEVRESPYEGNLESYWGDYGYEI
ncbi:MAG TPA: NB-ARC domain-containing protein, partial [Kamptonema sp.]|nr:NB-ARC domain-containing protein [Kamptonema sp.]